MPALCEPSPHDTSFGETPSTTYICAGAALILCAGAIVRRRSRPQAAQGPDLPFAEKEALRPLPDGLDMEVEQDPSGGAPPQQYNPESSPPPKLPPPPTQAFVHQQSSLSSAPIPKRNSPRASFPPLNLDTTLSHQPASYITMPMDTEFTSSPTEVHFTNSPISLAHQGDLSLPIPLFSPDDFPWPTAAEPETMPPRRRSYTRMTSAGTEISGEIVSGDGYRRHTRVFGGGVCRACEESDGRRGTT